jgi:hypothetical protein
MRSLVTFYSVLLLDQKDQKSRLTLSFAENLQVFQNRGYSTGPLESPPGFRRNHFFGRKNSCEAEKSKTL